MFVSTKESLCWAGEQWLLGCSLWLSSPTFSLPAFTERWLMLLGCHLSCGHSFSSASITRKMQHGVCRAKKLFGEYNDLWKCARRCKYCGGTQHLGCWYVKLTYEQCSIGDICGMVVELRVFGSNSLAWRVVCRHLLINTRQQYPMAFAGGSVLTGKSGVLVRESVCCPSDLFSTRVWFLLSKGARGVWQCCAAFVARRSWMLVRKDTD
jgi:hypothetical protein